MSCTHLGCHGTLFDILSTVCLLINGTTKTTRAALSDFRSSVNAVENPPAVLGMGSRIEITSQWTLAIKWNMLGLGQHFPYSSVDPYIHVNGQGGQGWIMSNPRVKKRIREYTISRGFFGFWKMLQWNKIRSKPPPTPLFRVWIRPWIRISRVIERFEVQM